MSRALQTIAVLLCVAPARAHEGFPLEPHDLWTRDAWLWDPLAVAALALSAWLYRLAGRHELGLRKWGVRCYWAGWLALAASLLSPIHAMGEVLFSAHMAQHELMMVVAAPLLVLGRPIVPFLWALPANARRAAGRWSRSSGSRAPWMFFARPLSAFLLHLVVIWAWHAPALFQATLKSAWIHSAQHLSFLVSALFSGGRSSAGTGRPGNMAPLRCTFSPP
jgi:cytochrome c oxidase assembly factor CtaG